MLWQQFPLTVVENMCQLHFFLWVASSSASLHRIALHLHSLNGRKRERGRRASNIECERALGIVAAFSSWLLCQPQDRITVGYQGKSQAQTMLYVCFAPSMCASVCTNVCGSVCLCAVTWTHPSSHQFLATIRRSKQPSIHGAMHLSIYPCSCPSVRLMSLASITMYHATHVFSLALYVGVKSLTCASIDAALQRPSPSLLSSRCT